MAEKKKISAYVGQPVQIKLQSMAGSTGYAWYLTKLDGGLALSSAVVIPTAPGVAPVNHVFDFLACTVGSFQVVFELAAAWRPGEAAETEIFEVEIKAKQKSAKQEIESALGGREFIHASVANVGAQVEPSHVLKYAAPMASSVPQAQACGPVAAVTPQTVILYAAPMTAGPATQAAVPSQAGTLSAATMIAYAAPIGPSTMAVYAMHQADPCLQDPCLQALHAHRTLHPMYAAPMFQPYAAPWAYMQPQPMYAAPMIRYAAPMASPPQECC